MTPVATIDRLQAGDHVCWAFDDDASLLDPTSRFVSTGIDSGEKVLCFLEELDTDELLRWLTRQGIDTSSAISRGQIQFRSATESYLSTGWFKPDEVLEGWRVELQQARDEGYGNVRVIADMSWAFRPLRVSAAERLAWYEAQANRVFAGGDATVICLYDRRRVDADELDRIAMAHHGSTLTHVNGCPWPQLRLLHTTDPPGLRIIGEADLATREALLAVLTGLAKDLAADDRPITVDVGELSFADGGAAQALVCAARTAPAGMRIVGASATLARLISLVGGRDVPGLSVHLNHIDHDVNSSSPEGSEQD
jgi:anti-anti-sigma regulatory factor